MKPVLEICNVHGCHIDIRDLSIEEYIPEDIVDETFLQEYYNDNKFKYSQTCTIDIIEYVSRNISKIQVIDTIFTLHVDEDIVHFEMPKDGYYKVYHFILPTKQFIDTTLVDLDLWYTDGKYIYHNGLTKSSEELISVNIINSTISKEVQETFSICSLYNCYISICKQIFDSIDIKCLNSGPYDYKRDFLWMSINIIKYYVEQGLLYEAQRVLETITKCNGFCKDVSNKYNTDNCGCS